MSNQPELDKILTRLENAVELDVVHRQLGSSQPRGRSPKAIHAEAKQAILNLINKQVEEVIKKPHILPKNAQHLESVKQGINFYHRQMRKRVDKLKESK